MPAFLPIAPLSLPSSHRPSLRRRPPQACLPPPHHTASLLAGIRAVAVGKHGSRAVPPDALDGIGAALAALEAAEDASPAAWPDLALQRASLLGALFVKAAIAPGEEAVLARVAGEGGGFTRGGVAAADVVDYVGRRGEVGEVSGFAVRALAGEVFGFEDARRLGRVMFDGTGGAGERDVRAMLSHVMRIRHESGEEIAGMADAVNEGVWGGLGEQGVSEGRARAVLIAEPFDGCATWDMISPAVALHFGRRWGMGAVWSVGESSGPKYGPNLRHLAQELGVGFAKSGAEVKDGCRAAFGIAVDQNDVVPKVAEWVAVRRVILKRPCLATAEKYVDGMPGGCAVFLGSVFHDSYVEKMAVVAERRGFEGYIVFSRGAEGCIGVPGDGRRQAKLCVGRAGARQGEYERIEIVAGKVEGGNEGEEKGRATVERAVGRIQRWVEVGTSGNTTFDERVRVTLEAVDQAMEFIRGGEGYRAE